MPHFTPSLIPVSDTASAPVVLAAEGDAVPVVLAAEGDAVPVVLATEGDAVPVVLAAEGDAAPVVLAADTVPVVLTQPDVVPVASAEEGFYTEANHMTYIEEEAAAMAQMSADDPQMVLMAYLDAMWAAPDDDQELELEELRTRYGMNENGDFVH